MTGENSESAGKDEFMTSDFKNGYIKTTSMARFYYSRGGVHTTMHKSVSDHEMLNETEHLEVERRKSKSQSDLASVAQNALLSQPQSS